MKPSFQFLPSCFASNVTEVTLRQLLDKHKRPSKFCSEYYVMSKDELGMLTKHKAAPMTTKEKSRSIQ